jgi:hypothetical protein
MNKMSLENILGWGKRTVSLSLIVSAVAATSLLTRCNTDNSDSRRMSASYAKGISDEIQQMLPIWKPADLEINKHKSMVLAYSTELNVKPKFYKGSMPLTYESLQTPGAGYTYGSSTILAQEFKDFSNYFIYESSVFLVGAVSVDKNNTMVAEAKITYSNKDIMAKPEMEEFHYADGKLIYHCFSQIDMSTGMKTGERERSGKKKKEYYFIVPVNE